MFGLALKTQLIFFIVGMAALSVSVDVRANPYLTQRTRMPATVDENGVELGTGQFIPPSVSSSIGNGQSGMSDTIGGMDFPGSSLLMGGVDSIDPSVFATGASKTMADTSVFYGGHTVSFGGNLYSGLLTSPDGGATLDFGGGGGGYNNPFAGLVIWTASDGTIIELDGSQASDLDFKANHAAVSRVIKPDGEILNYSYSHSFVPTGDPDPGLPGHLPEFLVSSSLNEIKSSLGWRVYGSALYGGGGNSFNNRSYVTANLTGVGATPLGDENVQAMTSLTEGPYTTTKQRLAHKLLVSGDERNFYVKQYVEERKKYYFQTVCVGCSEGGSSAFYTPTNASQEYFENLGANERVEWYYIYVEKMEVINLSGVKTVATFYTPPDDYSNATGSYGGCPSIGNGPKTCVTSITKGGSVWHYTWSYVYNPTLGYGEATVDIEDPSGHHRQVTTKYNYYRGTLITRDQDDLGNVNLYEYDTYGRLTKATHSEENYEQYFYDARGNLIEARYYPKNGGAPVIEYADYDLVCMNLKTCNKPNWVKDANGNETDYTYSPIHGGILSVTYPPDANGVHAQTRYTYSQLTPQVLNGYNILEASTPVWRLTNTSTCRSSTNSCAGTADETLTEYAYNDPNLMLTSVTVRAGDNSSTATTSYGYDFVGNRVWVDGPLPGTVDKTYAVYDDRRRAIFEIGPDPDGSGNLPSVAVHHLYDVDGREYRTETGTGVAASLVNCSSTTATCSAFAVTSYTERTYDATTGLEIKSITVQP